MTAPKKDKLMFTLNRDYVLSTLLGHSIRFEKGVPTHVPYMVVSQAMAIGAVPVGELPVEDAKPTAEPGDPGERQELILAAFEDLFLSNKREDFTATGVPTVDAVSRELGFKVQAKEIAAAKTQYDLNKAGA